MRRMKMRWWGAVGAALMLAGCEGAEAKCQRLRTDFLTFDLLQSSQRRKETEARYRALRLDTLGQVHDARFWRRVADSLDDATTRQALDASMTDRAWYRQHCQ